MIPLVSVLIPCHNAARWIAATLDSVLAQTWPAREIIVVDNGSTDGSAKVIAGFESRGVRLVTSPKVAASVARNHAFRLSRGEFIKFLDADDLISPQMIELQVRALQSRPAHVAYSEWARFHTDPAEAVFKARRGCHDARPVDWLVEIWSDGEPMMQCGQFLIPRPLLDQAGGWDERLSLIDDFEFFSRLVLTSEGVVFTPGAQLFYRSGLTGSLSQQRTEAAWQSAARSVRLGTDHLLRAESSERTRHAAAAMLQILVYNLYPNCPALGHELERHIVELGGSSLRPQGGKAFQIARRLVGWKTARWMQIRAGKYPQPLRTR